MEDRDAKGRFKKGCVANPNGNNQFTSIVPLLEALEKVGKGRNEDFWMMVARRCWESDRILAAILRKIIPDKLDLIAKEEGKPYLHEECKDMTRQELEEEAYQCAKKIIDEREKLEANEKMIKENQEKYKNYKSY